VGLFIRLIVGLGICVVSFTVMFYLSNGSDPSDKPATQDLSVEQDNTAPRAVAGLPANANLRINDEGIEIIKQSEGLRLDAYQTNGQWLIGYGHAATAKPGMTITEATARDLLRQDLRTTEDGLKKSLTVAVNRNEFSAMVSLAYNLGLGGFKKTVVFDRINQGDRSGAADGFLKHDRVRINGVLQPVAHLTERRVRERALFLK